MLTRVDAETYLAGRTGRLEYRFLRYAAVADELEAAGLTSDDLLVDVGAGMCDFDFYLRTVRGWKGRYLPVDRSIDGTNLETWEPGFTFPYAVMIETLEHVLNWRDLLELLEAVRANTECCLVITTPNTDRYGEAWVRAMDETHVSPITSAQLEHCGNPRWSVHSFFGQPEDSLLAVWRKT